MKRDNEKRQSPDELRRELERHRLLADALPDAVYLLDLDGSLIYVNAAAATMMGTTPEALVGKRQEEVFPASEAKRHVEAVRDVIATGEQRVTVTLTTIGNREYWLENRLTPLSKHGDEVAAVLGVSRDVTARKRAEDALMESEERFRTVVEDALIGIYRTTPDGRVLLANRAATRLLGFESAEAWEAAGLDSLAVKHAYRRERFKTLMERDGHVRGFESTWRRDDGSRVHIRENARAVLAEDGSIAYYEGTIEDLSAQRALEEQLRRAQRMETIGRLAGGIAHDFNNLLQAMLGNVQLLRLQLAESERFHDSFEEMEALVVRGRALTRQLLLFSRQDVTRPRKLDLSKLIRDASAFLRRLVRANVHLDVQLTPLTLAVDADPGQLEQVLANLVLNAVDAMPEGGVLTIRTGRDGRRCWFEVADTGCGIPEASREAIFEPFFSTKDPAQGAGLGLSVVHGIVERHGGAVTLTSEVGGGSTFRVVLPPHDSGVFPAVTAGDAEGIEGGPTRVLVVEDSQPVRDLFLRMLTHLGCRVRTVADAESALELPDEPPYDVLLTDFMLPGASGLQLADALRQRWPQLAVLVMSGYSESESIQDAATTAGVHFLQKPVDLDTLAAALREALRVEEGDRSE